MRSSRKKVGRCRSDREDVGFGRETDVIECVARTENLTVGPASGDGLKRYRAYKLERRPGHHDVDFCACLGEQAREHDCLVAGNSPRYAEENAAAVEGPQRAYSVRRRGITRYSISPRESSSRARVVSFFSPLAERSRGNSLITRANFAATRTPRYLLVACSAMS